MRFKRWAWLPLLLLLPLLAVACGDEGSGTSSGRDVSADELGMMVLTTEEMYEALPGFSLYLYEPASGPYSNEVAIEGDFDPEDERADVERYGRIDGYHAEYASQGDEPTRVIIALDLFKTADGASGYLPDAFDDLGRWQELSKLDMGGVGDESLGFVSRFPGPDSILIGFRFQQILGLVGIHNVDSEKSQEWEVLARRLAEKIEMTMDQ